LNELGSSTDTGAKYNASILLDVCSLYNHNIQVLVGTILGVPALEIELVDEHTND
jgi:hypothetical protein